MSGHRHTLTGRRQHRRRPFVSAGPARSSVHDEARNTDYPAVLLRKATKAWIALRQSDHPLVIQGDMSTLLMRVPLAWFRLMKLITCPIRHERLAFDPDCITPPMTLASADPCAGLGGEEPGRPTLSESRSSPAR